MNTQTAPIATLLSVEQVAQVLNLNVRTVRNYVRSGALKSARIGKQYRIATPDLQAFMGRPLTERDEVVIASAGRVDVACIITVDGITPERAERMTTALVATADVLRSIERPVSVSTTYEAQLARMRVLLAADMKSARDFLSIIDAALEPSA